MLDKQTCKLVSRITENLPDLGNETMQWLIEHPQELKKFLEGLCLLRNNPVKSFKMVTIRRFMEERGIIYFSVDSDGMTIGERMEFLESRGFNFSPLLKSVIYSTNFNHELVGTTNIALIKWTIFNDNARTTKNIRDIARARGFEKLNPLVAFFIRNQIDVRWIREMCLDSIVVMHDPISDWNQGSKDDWNQGPNILSIDRPTPMINSHHPSIDTGKECLLGVKSDHPEKKWGEMIGFAFATTHRMVTP